MYEIAAMVTKVKSVDQVRLILWEIDDETKALSVLDIIERDTLEKCLKICSKDDIKYVISSNGELIPVSKYTLVRYLKKYSREE